MPIKIPDALPAVKTLEQENIFVMTNARAIHQDIRPLELLIVNLMPNKIETETQILRLLGNTPLQVEVELMQMKSHKSKNTPAEHLLKIYKTFDEIKGSRFDGMIVTGAPVETLDFEQVDYWDELCGVFEWAKQNVYSSMFICWASQAALYNHYGINKVMLPKKLTGIFSHRCMMPEHPLMRGFDDNYFAPHSRYTSVDEDAVRKTDGLDILGESDEAGIHIVADRECRLIFVTGHSEYDRCTLKNEFERDKKRGLDNMPLHYFGENGTEGLPEMCWKAHANLLFSNWINHIVYQKTPFDLINL